MATFTAFSPCRWHHLQVQHCMVDLGQLVLWCVLKHINPINKGSTSTTWGRTLCLISQLERREAKSEQITVLNQITICLSDQTNSILDIELYLCLISGAYNTNHSAHMWRITQLLFAWSGPQTVHSILQMCTKYHQHWASVHVVWAWFNLTGLHYHQKWTTCSCCLQLGVIKSVINIVIKIAV